MGNIPGTAGTYLPNPIIRTLDLESVNVIGPVCLLDPFGNGAPMA